MTRRLGIDVLFTVAPPEAARKLYADRLPHVDLVHTITGFVPDDLERRKSRPAHRRPLDVGYRGRTLPYHLGNLAHEKMEIAPLFIEHVSPYGLVCDIAWSENERIYGEAWNRFLSSCRTTLGTESGASIADFDGSIERRTLAYLEANPGALYDEVHEAVLAPYEGNVVVNTMSPRLLEAAALRSALVLYVGEYSGAVEPWETYVPLEKDFSNMDEIVAFVRDDRRVDQMADRAHRALIESGEYSHRRFVADFDDLVSTRAAARATIGTAESRAPRNQPRIASAAREAGTGLRRRAQTTRAVLHALRRYPALRRVAGVFVRSRRLRHRFGWQRLADDLLRLAIIHQRFLPTPFAVDLRLERDGLLTVYSRATASPPLPRALDRSKLEEALADPCVLGVVWDHSRVGVVAALHRPGAPDLALGVGYHGRDGIYMFSVLSELARNRRPEAMAALAPLTEPPRGLDPGYAVGRGMDGDAGG
jgi:hypothetical protein